MTKKYSELQAWSIFFGGLIIGIVLTSIFWAYITAPKDSKSKINQTENVSSESEKKENHFDKPVDFISECRKIEGTPKWDSAGFRSCTAVANSQRNLLTMNFFCKKYGLNLSVGSFGIKCEGIE